MKNYIFITSLFLASSIYAKDSNQLFTKKQNEQVLREIDNICGDTWCEGEYNFEFINFSCKKSTLSCELDFKFVKIDERDNNIYSQIQSCEFENITKFTQLIDASGDLTEVFYHNVSSCIHELEENVQL